jgi:hypothetical protein
MMTTHPPTRMELDQLQRRSLGQVLRFARRPRAVTPARWRVMELSAASYITGAELQAIQGSADLGKLDLRSWLEACADPGEKGAA